MFQRSPGQRVRCLRDCPWAFRWEASRLQQAHPLWEQPPRIRYNGRPHTGALSWESSFLGPPSPADSTDLVSGIAFFCTGGPLSALHLGLKLRFRNCTALLHSIPFFANQLLYSTVLCVLSNQVLFFIVIGFHSIQNIANKLIYFRFYIFQFRQRHLVDAVAK